MAANIERALTQRDEFGRIMTPKERFRVLNYGCALVFAHTGVPYSSFGSYSLCCQRPVT